MSAFFDTPVRFINPDANQNAAGIGDIGFGGKYALIYNQKRVVSAWLRFQAPAGSPSKGLGNGNWWMDTGHASGSKPGSGRAGAGSGAHGAADGSG